MKNNKGSKNGKDKGIQDASSRDIQKITSPIDGLVGVAQASLANQSLEHLYVCCCHLEENIKSLDNMLLDLELKKIDESGDRKHIYEAMITHR